MALPLAVMVLFWSIAGAVPTLDEMGGDWITMELKRDPPAINNAHGSIAAGGHMCELSLNGKKINATESMWKAYEIQRRVSLPMETLHGQQSEVSLLSQVRMVYEDNGVFFSLSIHQNESNNEPQIAPFNISIDLSSLVRFYDNDTVWTWSYPTPKPADYPQFKSEVLSSPFQVVVMDTLSPSVAAFGFTNSPISHRVTSRGSIEVTWTVSVSNFRVEIAFAFGTSRYETLKKVSQWTEDFSTIFEGAKSNWEKRWNDAFIPHNGHFSGSLPVLDTDDEVMSRMYYSSILSMLSMERTNAKIYDRVYITGCGGLTVNIDNQTIPDQSIGATYRFFWDTMFEATLLSMLDPKAVLADISTALTVNFHKYFGVDTQSGVPGGYYYAANDYAIFTLIDTYLRVTGDFSFLSTNITDNKTGFQWMYEIATFWKHLQSSDPNFSDYGGDPNNFLECVPTYVHGVPSLNAANVWMMRRMSEWCAFYGNQTCAKELLQQANKTATQVLKLFVKEGGFWSFVQVRHVLDFITIASCMIDDLSEDTSALMQHFFETELLTTGWIRALSLRDKIAPVPRPDHGTSGSYPAWPSLAVYSYGQWHNYSYALSLLHQFEPTTHEGPIGQADQVDPPHEPFKTVGGYTRYFELVGGTFAETVVRTFFGYQPGIEWNVLHDISTPRTFIGTLRHVSYRGTLYTIESTTEGLKLSREN